MRHRRRKDRRYLLPVGAAAVAVAAVAGGVLVLTKGDGGSDRAAARDDGPAEPPAARIDCARQGKVPGSGSTAQSNAMKRWIEEYERACPGVRIAYNPIGSGAGVAQFLQGITAFGGTDGALDTDDVASSRDVCPGGHAIDLPMVGGPIAIGYHLPDVHDLVLDAPTLARIFDSRITRWNDPAIRRLNPRAALPDLAIRPVHRSDSSGTTQNLNAYLAGAAPDQWPYPAEKSWHGRGGDSADGSVGVASEVMSTGGAIGYFELSFASKRHIDTVRIDTGAAEPVEASPETASAGIASARVVGEDKDLSLKFDYGTSAPGAYPIVLVTYEVVCDKGNDKKMLPALKSFLAYTASEEGQKILPGIHYAPLPESVAAQVRKVIGTLS
ncbi:phosphate ABC transporter substrate-binding protein PstS [Streptomyces sp. MUM 178J]|uniref:phosphate ABC transporter substrate-binding protein PstS n=1 Tax=Streptomyces sp. MUM 178J TaxID=2791991 RepID=UPI001F046B7C|nr:phosphate ABC transporter substrate-binding protein PstS [Streptomyces sp. MUM 178J]WRQ82928.1 phosphate ABC transporter substrate-binding protein PstS [Streptomyces sp. MUM 178J]